MDCSARVPETAEWRTGRAHRRSGRRGAMAALDEEDPDAELARIEEELTSMPVTNGDIR